MSEGAQIINRLPAVQFNTQDAFNPQMPHVPLIGCFPGDGSSTYVGKKFANRPDLLKLNHLKQKKKELEKRIITQTIGKLDNPERAIGFTEEIARITEDITTVVDAINETVGEATAEITDAISFANQQMNALNALRAEIENIPAEARGLLQQHLLTLYTDCFGKQEAKIAHLQSIIPCLGAF